MARKKRLFLDIFQKHNEEVNALIGKDYSYKTFQKLRTTFEHTKSFIRWKYAVSDLEIKDLNYEFVKDFSFWLKTVKNCNNNSTVKYIRIMKTVIIECIRKRWLNDDPLASLKCL